MNETEGIAERGKKNWHSAGPALGNEMKNIIAEGKAQLRVGIEKI